MKGVHFHSSTQEGLLTVIKKRVIDLIDLFQLKKPAGPGHQIKRLSKFRKWIIEDVSNIDIVGLYRARASDKNTNFIRFTLSPPFLSAKSQS